MAERLSKDSLFVPGRPRFLSSVLDFIISDTESQDVMEKLDKAAIQYPVRAISVAGGVSANSRFRSAVLDYGQLNDIEVLIPSFEYCTDNAGMIAIVGYFKYLKKDFCTLDAEPLVRGYQL